jgi:hypothetical protein
MKGKERPLRGLTASHTPSNIVLSADYHVGRFSATQICFGIPCPKIVGATHFFCRTNLTTFATDLAVIEQRSRRVIAALADCGGLVATLSLCFRQIMVFARTCNFISALSNPFVVPYFTVVSVAILFKFID